MALIDDHFDSTAPALAPDNLGHHATPTGTRPNILDPGFNLTLRPMRYPEFYEMYRDAIKNTWTVDEIDFSDDLVDLDRKLMPAEKHLINRLVAFFATGLNKYVSFGELAKHHTALADWVQANFVLAALCYLAGYAVMIAFSLPGVSDGGAHTKFSTLGAYSTEFLSELVRDAELMSLEDAHWRLSAYPAHAAGVRDRGYLREGAPADVVVYDLAELAMLPPEIARDFPGGEWRRIRKARGYRATIVNGQVTFEGQDCSGATPGRLLRHGRAAH